METSRLDYELPPEAIAQNPAVERDGARLLVDTGPDGHPQHRHVRDLPDLLQPGDTLVVNATRVLRARLALLKESGGAAEVLLLSPTGSDGLWSWDALVRPGRRLRPGSRLRLAAEPPAGSSAEGLRVVIGESTAGGRREVRLEGVEDPMVAMEAAGSTPLPPYITSDLGDTERYQTVFGHLPDRNTTGLAGSVAAPTAGLHLTDEVLVRCRERGVRVAEIHLDVGLGTFRPVTSDVLEDHEMHAERYVVPETTRRGCETASRVVAVGTTTVRALEAWAATGQPAGSTEIFITPGFRFQVVDALMTNFHMPRSSLLALVEAFVGPRWRDLYSEALVTGYRFLSFGDAMLLEGGLRPAPTEAP